MYGPVLAAALSVSAACTPSAPRRAARAPRPATSVVVASPPPPEPLPPPRQELPECAREHEELARRDRNFVAAFDVACLPLLESAEDVSFIKDLSLSGSPGDASDLAPLARLPALESIWIDIQPMVPLSALARIRTLQRVTISKPVETLAPVSGLTQVKRLSLDAYSPALRDVSMLSRLPALESFATKQPVDLAAVARAAPRLKGLGVLQATSLDALARFSELTSLSLGCFDSKTQRLPAPPKLESLAVDCLDPDAPLDPLASFPDLKELAIANDNMSEPDSSPLRSLSLVARMKKLRRLDIHGTRVTSLAPLAHCPDLEWLDMHDTQVRSFAPLGRLRHLEEIEATNTPVTSIAPLAASRSLVTLWLPGTRVHNVLPLARVKTLEELMLPGYCNRPDAVALGKRRPDMKLMEWTDGEKSEDPSCGH